MGHRLLRINENIRELLSAIITAEELKDPRVGFVTVTGVETSADLRHAKVFVSVLGDQATRAACLEALEHSRGYLQARINSTLHMRRTPQLVFVYDTTLDNALHIEELMKREEEVLGTEAPEILVDGAGDADEDVALEGHGDREGPS